MNLTLLGTGGGAGVNPDRCQTGLLVAAKERLLLFDCGAGVVRRLVEAGVHLPDVSTLFFTHYHSDHLVDYPEFVLSSWVMGRRGALRVFGPRGLARITSLLFDPDGVFDADIRSRAESPEVQALFLQSHGFAFGRPTIETFEIRETGPVVEGEGYAVRAMFVRHVPAYLSCLAYRVDTPEGSVVFSGDTCALDEMAVFAHESNVLVHDCTRPDAALAAVGFDAHHTGPEALGRIAQQAGVKRVVLTHISAVVRDEAMLVQMVKDVERHFSGDVVLGHDLLSIRIGGERS